MTAITERVSQNASSTLAIFGEVVKASPSAMIEFYELDCAPIGTALTIRWHNGVNGVLQPVVWQGVTYQPYPVSADGFEVDGTGRMPRPKLSVSNKDGGISSLIRSIGGDLVRSRLTRKRTLLKYLDAVNFPGGVNVNADPLAALPDELWFVRQKTEENFAVVEFELGSPLDLVGVQLPRRQILSDICPFRYRGADCGYSGGPVATVLDVPTGSLALDECSHKQSGCSLRFVGVPLRFGGFPGAGRSVR